MSDPERAATWIRASRTADLAGTGPFALSAGGVDLVAVRTATGLRVFEGRCPHQGALLGEGELDGDVLVCRNHRWRFDTATGRRDGGPQCLRACPSEVRGAELFVDTGALTTTTTATATRTLADLPGPKGWPVVGSAFDLEVDRLHLILEGWARTHGRAGSRPRRPRACCPREFHGVHPRHGRG